jgi:hypothetical protein
VNDFINENFQLGYTDFSSDPAQLAPFLNRDHHHFDPFWIGHYDLQSSSSYLPDENPFARHQLADGLTGTASVVPVPIDAANYAAHSQDRYVLNLHSTELPGNAISWPNYHGYLPDIDSAIQRMSDHATANDYATSILEPPIPDIRHQFVVKNNLLQPMGPSDDTAEQVPASTPSTRSSDGIQRLVCHDCPDQPAFTHKYLYNKHRRKHDRPNKCGICGQAFAFKRDLDRHVASKHAETTCPKLHFCFHRGCDRAQGGRLPAFPRKDTLVRHLRTHKDSKSGQQEETGSSSTTNGNVRENSSTEIF